VTGRDSLSIRQTEGRQRMPQKMILDGDPGHDDSIALMLAHGNPAVELVAVITPKRLRGRDLQAPFWGTRASSGTTMALRDRADVYATRMPTRGFFSHVTAARLWGMPLPRTLHSREELDVSGPRGHFVPVGRGLRGHRVDIDPEDIVESGGLRLTGRARTWCDLAALVSEEQLVAGGDFLLWWRHPASIRLDLVDLTAAFERFRGRRGRPLLIAALPLLTDHADSPPESAMRVRFRRAGLPTCLANAEIRDDAGRFVGMPDLAFPEYKTAFDYEGEVHRTDRVQWTKDLRRGPRFEDAGWSYIQGGSVDLADSRELLDLLRRRLLKRGWHPGR
jgi:hypothetical protein